MLGVVILLISAVLAGAAIALGVEALLF